MKVKDAIKALQKLDPNQELEGLDKDLERMLKMILDLAEMAKKILK